MQGAENLLWRQIVWNAVFYFIPCDPSLLSLQMHPGWLLTMFFVPPPPQIADCQKPQATETFVLSKAALLSNDFPEDVPVILECAHGYKKISGSGTTVCRNGQWSEPDLICEGKPPTVIGNSDYFVVMWLYYCQWVTWCFDHRERLWTAKTRAEYEIQYQRGHSVSCSNESVLW